MKAKQYLRQLEGIDNSIDRLEKELERLRGNATGLQGIRYDKDKVQTSPDPDKLLEDIARIEESAEALEGLRNEKILLRARIVAQIEAMPNWLHRKILSEKYLDGRSLGEIAKDTIYSPDHIRHSHGWALAEFQKLYLKDDIN